MSEQCEHLNQIRPVVPGAYPEAFAAPIRERILPSDCKLRRLKYLNNVIEQDHRFVKKKVWASQCFKSFHTFERTPEGV